MAIFDSYIIKYIMFERDVLLTIHSFSVLKSLANNAKLKFLLLYDILWKQTRNLISDTLLLNMWSNALSNTSNILNSFLALCAS